jgi:hypothetical protein
MRLPVYCVWQPGAGPASGLGAGPVWSDRRAAGAAGDGGVCVALWRGHPVRQAPAVLASLTGARLTQSALTQDALRRTAGMVGTAYARWRTAASEAPVVHTEHTGWRGGGEPAHLMSWSKAPTICSGRRVFKVSLSDPSSPEPLINYVQPTNFALPTPTGLTTAGGN